MNSLAPFLGTLLLISLTSCGAPHAESEPLTHFSRARGNWTAKSLICTRGPGKRQAEPLTFAMKLAIDDSRLNGSITEGACTMNFTSLIHRLDATQLVARDIRRKCSTGCDPDLCRRAPPHEQKYSYRLESEAFVLIHAAFGCDPAEIQFQRE
jgi:hypothetical protein